MATIKFFVNNGQTINIEQLTADNAVRVYKTENATTKSKTTIIPPGDVVMMLNYYRYIKDNDIQNDFLNPCGKNKG